MTFISRDLIKRNVNFMESDLFFDDCILARKKQYRCLKEYCGQLLAKSCDLDRIVEATRILNTLDHEKVGSLFGNDVLVSISLLPTV